MAMPRISFFLISYTLATKTGASTVQCTLHWLLYSDPKAQLRRNQGCPAWWFPGNQVILRPFYYYISTLRNFLFHCPETGSSRLSCFVNAVEGLAGHIQQNSLTPTCHSAASSALTQTWGYLNRLDPPLGGCGTSRQTFKGWLLLTLSQPRPHYTTAVRLSGKSYSWINIAIPRSCMCM